MRGAAPGRLRRTPAVGAPRGAQTRISSTATTLLEKHAATCSPSRAQHTCARHGCQRPAGMETGRTPTRGRAWGNAARASKMPPAPRYVRTSEPSRTLHTCRFLSNEPLASSWPLGEKATEYTACVCFVSAKMHAPVSASHSLRGQNRHLKGVCVGASLER